jgi:hypothetical protein
MERYKVGHLIDDTYQVIKVGRDFSVNYPEYDEIEIIVYQGSLADCNAWLQLHDKEYI